MSQKLRDVLVDFLYELVNRYDPADVYKALVYVHELDREKEDPSYKEDLDSAQMKADACVSNLRCIMEDLQVTDADYTEYYKESFEMLREVFLDEVDIVDSVGKKYPFTIHRLHMYLLANPLKKAEG